MVLQVDVFIRIPGKVAKEGREYYEEKRPAANIDTYIVASAIFSVTVLECEELKDIEYLYKRFI